MISTLRLLQVALLALVVLLPRESAAFFARGYFGVPADLGGGGGLYYTGSPIERGWDCTACHLDAPGIVRVTLSTDPPELITQKRYVPGVSYKIDAVLENETRGLDSKFNANGLVAEISAGNERAGVLKEGSGTELWENQLRPDGVSVARIVASTSDTIGRTRWSFSWTAPDKGTGNVTIYLGAVDGNGAGDRETARQDLLGDDVYVSRLILSEAASAGASSTGAPARLLPQRHLRWKWGSSLLLIACSVLLACSSLARQRLRA